MAVLTQNITARILQSSSSSSVWPSVDDGYRMSPLTQHLAIIVILSLLVLAGLMFAIFGLLLKAEAVSRAGPCNLQESLLFDDKDWKFCANLSPALDKN